MSKSEYAFHAALKPGRTPTLGQRPMHVRCFKRRLEPTSRSRSFQWEPGLLWPCIGRSALQHGRVFIAGDAAHLFTPTGGLGYNTAIEDAINLA
ncbi:MAG: FAD-dependent monooxygenase [Betaproteobacteria bacterium]|nr:FAD-dependent monooxygenase [Betaproteobacteria bacterium]